jgi:hypothetical protein
MKRTSLVLSILGLLAFFTFAADASAQSAPVAGVYENFTVGKESSFPRPMVFM